MDLGSRDSYLMVDIILLLNYGLCERYNRANKSTIMFHRENIPTRQSGLSGDLQKVLR